MLPLLNFPINNNYTRSYFGAALAVALSAYGMNKPRLSRNEFLSGNELFPSLKEGEGNNRLLKILEVINQS